MTIVIGIVTVVIQSVHKNVKGKKEKEDSINYPDNYFGYETKLPNEYSKKKTIGVTLFVPLVLFIGCFVFALMFEDYKYNIDLNYVASSNLQYSSMENELSKPNVENYDFNHSSNIVNGGQGCFDGTRYFFSGEYLWSEDISGDDSKIIYDKTIYCLNSVGNYLYFTSPDEEDAICRIKKDGTDFKIIYNNYCHELTYYNGWLYFSSDLGDSDNSDYQICRMRLDGSDFTVLADCRAWYMTIYNDKIFFCNYDDGRSIYSMNIDGSEYKLLRSGECCELCIVDNKIYFATDMEQRNLHCVDINGNNEEVLIGSYVQNTNYYNKKLYFVNAERAICCCDLNGNNLQVLYNDSTSYTFITLLPGKICCSNSSNNQLIIYSI